VKGAFSKVTGTVNFDPNNLATSTVDATIDVSTVDTRQPQRDADLRSPNFFDVEKFPTMTFKSTSVKPNGDGGYNVTGDLSLHGQTRQQTFVVDGPSAPGKDPWGNTRIGLSATTKISRKDFGLNWNAALETGGIGRSAKERKKWGQV